MKYRKSNRFAKPISEIGFGAWQLGGMGTWGYMTKEEGISLVKEAIKEGVNFFDTAPGYGQGKSELILGEALLEDRDKVFINTKIGHGPNGEYEFTAEGVSNSIHRSLRNLQTNYLDSVILHNPEKYILEDDTTLFNELDKFKEEGLINGYGVSIDTIAELKLTLKNLNVDVIEIMFNVIQQEVKELFNEVAKKGILLIIKVPLDSGWLTGKYNHLSQFTGVRNRWSKNDIIVRSRIIDKIKNIIEDKSLVHAALRFILSFKEVTTIIPGTKNIDQLKMNCIASNDYLAQSTKEELEDLYQNYIKNLSVPW